MLGVCACAYHQVEILAELQATGGHIREKPAGLRHWAIEINVRMGGTTLPIMTLNLASVSPVDPLTCIAG